MGARGRPLYLSKRSGMTLGSPRKSSTRSYSRCGCSKNASLSMTRTWSSPNRLTSVVICSA